MRWLVVAYLFGLWMPGLWAARRCGLYRRGEGVVALVGVGYVASLALLLPVALVGFAFRLPIATLSGAVALASAAAAVALCCEAWISRASLRLPCPSPIALTCGGIILLDLVLGALAGPNTSGDARFHIARARVLLDHGFNNYDPYLAGQIFTRAYHTNIFHALLAAGARLLGTQPYVIWLSLLPWAKAVSAAGVYLLTLAATRRRGLAWAAAAAAAIWVAPIGFSLYPNRIAPLWLGCTALAFGLRYYEAGSRRAVLGLLLTLGVMPFVHQLSSAFASLLLAPLLVLAVARHRRRGARRAVVALASLALCVPMLAASKLHGPYAGAAPEPYPTLPGPPPRGAPPEDDADVLELEEPDAHDEADDEAVDAGRVISALPLLNPLLWATLGLLVGLVGPRRRAALGLLIMLTGFLLVVHVPPLGALLIHASGGFPWVVDRYATWAWFAMWAALALPGTLGSRLPPLARRVVVLVVACGLVGTAAARGVDSGYWSRHRYVVRARQDAVSHTRGALDFRRALAREHIPAGAVVISGLGKASVFCMLHDVWFIGAHHLGSPGVPHANRRARDAWGLMNDWKMSPDVRRTLLHYYDADLVYWRRKYGFRPRHLRRLHTAYRGMIAQLRRDGELIVVTLEKPIGAGQPSSPADDRVEPRP